MVCVRVWLVAILICLFIVTSCKYKGLTVFWEWSRSLLSLKGRHSEELQVIITCNVH